MKELCIFSIIQIVSNTKKNFNHCIKLISNVRSRENTVKSLFKNVWLYFSSPTTFQLYQITRKRAAWLLAMNNGITRLAVTDTSCHHSSHLNTTYKHSPPPLKISSPTAGTPSIGYSCQKPFRDRPLPKSQAQKIGRKPGDVRKERKRSRKKKCVPQRYFFWILAHGQWILPPFSPLPYVATYKRLWAEIFPALLI